MPTLRRVDPYLQPAQPYAASYQSKRQSLSLEREV